MVGEEERRRGGGGQGMETRPSSGPVGTEPLVEDSRGGGGSSTWRGRVEPRRDRPRGSSGALATSRAVKRGQTDRGRGGRNMLALRCCRSRKGHGKCRNLLSICYRLN